LPGFEPKWWYETGPHWQAALLSPVAALVGAITAARLRSATPFRSRLPVICVGNFTAGGSGKTPLALFLAKRVAEQKRQPWFLSRGYGGRLTGPTRVDPGTQTAQDVGDEPLLLARRAPTFVSRDRRQGAEAIEASASGEAVIIMDDGLQNPALYKDLSIAVVDAHRGFGNGQIIPAGPLRAALSMQASLANLIVLTNRTPEGDAALSAKLRALTNAPIVSAETRVSGDKSALRRRGVIAYAGIANPNRFFAMLEDQGATIVERRAFADHHPFREAEAQDLIDAARRASADLITTEKDLVRLSGGVGAIAELRERSEVLAIETAIQGDDLATVDALIRRALNR
jgi:tetraacyldisaccharide 4'-kinase